jgi:hypothetical protein
MFACKKALDQFRAWVELLPTFKDNAKLCKILKQIEKCAEFKKVLLCLRFDICIHLTPLGLARQFIETCGT